MKIYFLPIAVILLLPFIGHAAVLESVSDAELTEVLANFQILAVADHQQSRSMYVRILKVQDHGECSGSPNTCPKSRIYITVSEYGEYPEQKVYRLPPRHNWEFVGWIKLPHTDNPQDYVQLRLKAQKPAKDLTMGWWINETYIVKVNYRNGTWDKE
jgi:hypothetical protein